MHKIVEKCADAAFISRGFSNWKDALVSLKNHAVTVSKKLLTPFLPHVRVVETCCLVNM